MARTAGKSHGTQSHAPPAAQLPGLSRIIQPSPHSPLCPRTKAHPLGSCTDGAPTLSPIGSNDGPETSALHPLPTLRTDIDNDKDNDNDNIQSFATVSAHNRTPRGRTSTQPPHLNETSRPNDSPPLSPLSLLSNLRYRTRPRARKLPVVSRLQTQGAARPATHDT